MAGIEIMGIIGDGGGNAVRRCGKTVKSEGMAFLVHNGHSADKGYFEGNWSYTLQLGAWAVSCNLLTGHLYWIK